MQKRRWVTAVSRCFREEDLPCSLSLPAAAHLDLKICAFLRVEPRLCVPQLASNFVDGQKMGFQRQVAVRRLKLRLWRALSDLKVRHARLSSRLTRVGSVERVVEEREEMAAVV